MSETPVTITLGAWNRLGARTYWLFLSEKLTVAICFLVLGLVLSIARSLAVFPGEVRAFLGLGGAVCFVIFLAALLFAALASWFTYSSYGYCLSEDALKVRRGIITKQEIAIPYRQIQNVDIERSFSQQMMGLSSLLILTAGHEDAAEHQNDSEGILPALDKNLAAALQEELIKRAEVQKIIQAK